MSDARSPEPGDRISFLVHGLSHHRVISGMHTGVVSRRGDELTVTTDLLDANRDRNGDLPAWLRLLHDPEGQVRHFGQQVVSDSAWDKSLLLTLPGEPEHEDARREAIRTANLIEDKADRKAALRDVEAMFGPAPSTSRTNALYAGADL